MRLKLKPACIDQQLNKAMRRKRFLFEEYQPGVWLFSSRQRDTFVQITYHPGGVYAIAVPGDYMPLGVDLNLGQLLEVIKRLG